MSRLTIGPILLLHGITSVLFCCSVVNSAIATWSFQSKVVVSPDNQTTPCHISGQAEKVLFSGYDGYKVGVHVSTSQFIEGKTTWTHQALLTPDKTVASKSVPSIDFGYESTLLENFLFVASPRSMNYENIQSGGVYVFNGSRNSWTQQQIIYSSISNAGAISLTYIVMICVCFVCLLSFIFLEHKTLSTHTFFFVYNFLI